LKIPILNYFISLLFLTIIISSCRNKSLQKNKNDHEKTITSLKRKREKRKQKNKLTPTEIKVVKKALENVLKIATNKLIQKAAKDFLKNFPKDITEIRTFKEGTKTRSESMMSLSIFANSYDAVNTLLDRWGEKSLDPGSKFPIVHIAVRKESKEIIKLLSEKGKANVNAIDARGMTPLIRSVRNKKRKNTDTILALLNTNADLNIQGGSPKVTALIHAILKGDTEVVELLLKEGPDLNLAGEDGLTPLHIAARMGLDKIVELLLKYGAKPNGEREDGLTPLHIAAGLGHYKIVELLLRYKANLNPVSITGITPLYNAADKGYEKIVELLLKHGANKDYQTSSGITSLYRATVQGHLAVVKVLLVKKANVNLAEYTAKWKPLHLAVKENHKEIAKLLLPLTKNLNQPLDNGSGDTIAHIAARYSDGDITEYIMKGDGVGIRNSQDHTPLHVAAHNNKAKNIQEILDINKSGIDEQEGNEKASAIFCSSGLGFVEVVKVLLKNGADSNLGNNLGLTPLLNASFKGHPKIVELLIQYNANINFQEISGVTALFVATQEGFVEVVKVLLKYHADKEITSNQGLRPLDVAMSKNNTEIINLLRNQT